MDERLVTVVDCARCGGHHEGLKFKKMSKPPTDSDGVVWDFWALCPTSNDPILIRFVDIPVYYNPHYLNN